MLSVAYTLCAPLFVHSEDGESGEMRLKAGYMRITLMRHYPRAASPPRPYASAFLRAQPTQNEPKIKDKTQGAPSSDSP